MKFIDEDGKQLDYSEDSDDSRHSVLITPAANDEEDAANVPHRHKITEAEARKMEVTLQTEYPLWRRVLIVIWKIVLLLLVLYGFFVGLSLLSDAFRIIAGKAASDIFSFVSNPMAGLMIGLLATVVFQSSSTTTSITVSLVGANVLSVGRAVPIIFGANIGTSITNTLVSLGQIASGEQFKRAFAGATVHDLFNIANVVLWMPIEWIVSSLNDGCGFYCYICGKLTHSIKSLSSGTFDSPLDYIIKPLTHAITKIDSDVYQAFSTGCRSTGVGCFVEASNRTDGCFAGNGICIDYAEWHAYYDGRSIVKNSFMKDPWHWSDIAIGITVLIVSLVLICGCLILLVKVLQMLIMGAAERAIRRVFNMNGYVAILVGTAITAVLQSSSVVTSALTPLVGVGVLSLEGMFPLTLGANIGTTLTAMLAAMATNSTNSVTIAFCHLFFNLFGTIVFYPVPILRRIPMGGAERLGYLVYRYRWFTFVYMALTFIVCPGYFLLVSLMIGGSDKGTMWSGIGIVIATVVLGIVFFVWYLRFGGHQWIVSKLARLRSDDYKKDLELQEKEAALRESEIKANLELTSSSTVHKK